MLSRALQGMLLVAVAGGVVLASGARAAPQQSDRELSGIAEEQALLRRQLQRLRLTMTNLHSPVRPQAPTTTTTPTQQW